MVVTEMHKCLAVATQRRFGRCVHVRRVETVDFVTGAGGVTPTAEDRLTIVNQGTGLNQVGVAGSGITFGGIAIGSFTGGTSGSVPLKITFNASATQAAVSAILKYVSYANASATPILGTRTVRVQLTDGDGGTSNQASKTINVTH